MSNYVKVATVDEFKAKRLKTVSLLGKKVAVVKEDDGSFFAVEVSCKHQGADLTQGKLEGDVATCPRHGWKYDLKSGECLNQDSAPLRRHDLVIEGDEIRVSLFPASAAIY